MPGHSVLRPILSPMAFITALCLVVDADGRHLRYARAGHPPLLEIRRGSQPKSIPCSGVALGLYTSPIEFQSSLQEIEIELQPGNRYFLFTDGLIETLNRKKETYGMQRLSKILARGFRQGPEQAIRQVVADVRRFRDAAPISDDLTLLALEVPPRPRQN